MIKLIRGAKDWRPDATEDGTPIWQPKSKGKPRRVAK